MSGDGDLVLVAGGGPVGLLCAWLLGRRGLRVRLFPCSDYNFTIEAERNYAREELRRKRFIHFKGNRKAMQSQYLARMRSGEL